LRKMKRRDNSLWLMSRKAPEGAFLYVLISYAFDGTSINTIAKKHGYSPFIFFLALFVVYANRIDYET